MATTLPNRLQLEPAWIAKLRSAFWAAGYQTAKVAEAMGADDEHLQPDPAQSLVVARGLPAGANLSTLIRLFLLGHPAAEDEAARALAPLTLEQAVELGILRAAAGGGVEGTLRIVPHRDFLVACSRVPERMAIESDHVMGVTRSSTMLASLTLRRPVELALDLGSGSGVQSLFLARHATRVIAVDINPVAVQFTAFNARLNGADNVEVREGSFLEPVAGLRFDLVATNPPFVISPDGSFLYRDSPLPGDELSQRVVRDVAEALQPGGLATVLVSWGRRPGETWDARPRGWVEGLGCDAFIFHQASQTNAAHAASWHEPLAQTDLPAFGEAVERWTRYADGLGYESIAFGAVLLRRRSLGAAWVRTEELPAYDISPATDQLERMLAAQDLLSGLSGRQALLDRVLDLVPNHHLDQRLAVRDGSYHVEQALLQLDDAIPFRAAVDPFNAYLVSRLDGRRTLREAIAESLQAIPQPDVEAADVESAATRSTRRMLELGFLKIHPAT